MSVNNVNNVGSSQPVSRVAAPAKPAAAESATPTTPTRASDRLELSGLSPLLKTAKAGGDIRADKVADIKAQIAAGTYETDDKIDGAVDKLLDELA